MLSRGNRDSRRRGSSAPLAPRSSSPRTEGSHSATAPPHLRGLGLDYSHAWFVSSSLNVVKPQRLHSYTFLNERHRFSRALRAVVSRCLIRPGIDTFVS